MYVGKHQGRPVGVGDVSRETGKNRLWAVTEVFRRDDGQWTVEMVHTTFNKVDGKWKPLLHRRRGIKALTGHDHRNILLLLTDDDITEEWNACQNSARKVRRGH